jgi:hypothetical protein
VSQYRSGAGSHDSRRLCGGISACAPIAGSRLPPHNVNMGQDHPFTVEIREHLNEERRFGWKIFENGKARDESPMHFSTKREAVTDAQKVMQRLVTRWQTDK